MNLPAGSTSRHPQGSFEASTPVHPLLARFQHQFAGQHSMVSQNPAPVPLVSQPAITPPVAVYRQPNPMTDSQQGDSKPTLGETIQAGGTSWPSVVSPSVGLRLRGLQPLVPRVSSSYFIWLVYQS